MTTEIRERLARLETAMGGTTETLKRIEAKLDAQHENMDGRLRTVERSSALHGTVAGGVVSLGIAFITAKLKGV